MQTSSDCQWQQETSRWCARAEEAIRQAAACDEAIALGREGVLLRRRWDLDAPDSPCRRDLLRLLPSTQGLAQRRLAEACDADGNRPRSLAEKVDCQIREADDYLVGLLDQMGHEPARAAFAIQCFRDDLAWLGTQTALLDGDRGVDFFGHVLLEQEAIDRQLDGCDWREPGDGTERNANDSSAATSLRRAASRLRALALTRQIESLFEQPEPKDADQWYHTWQTASRLAMRLDLPPNKSSAIQPEEAVPAAVVLKLQGLRLKAAEQWREAVRTPASPAQSLHAVAEDLTDAANEALTFVEDLPLDEAVRSLEILGKDMAVCREALGDDARAELRAERRAVYRWESAVKAELQERRLARRMEMLFGRRLVAGLERLILGLLVLFMVMLLAEGPLIAHEARLRGTMQGSITEQVFAWLDLAICAVFLGEFGLKWALAERRGLYLRRHWLTGLLPAIPVGFLAYLSYGVASSGEPTWVAEGSGAVLLLRSLRYLRLPSMARWLRVARPVLRAARLVGFLLRASDQIVRQLAPLINRNLVLFERADLGVPEPPYRRQLSALRERFYYRAEEAVGNLSDQARVSLIRARIDDLTVMLAAPGLRCVEPPLGQGSAGREIRLEEMIAGLLAATTASVSDRVARSLAQSVARWCRAFDVLGVRRLPVVRDLVVAGRAANPYETTALVANRLGALLDHVLDRVYWLADLYGTVTAPQLVDSMGHYMIKGTARPARRLVLIGGAFLAASYLASHFPSSTLRVLTEKLDTLFGLPLMVLGGICLAVFALGLWFRQIAGEATEFYTRVAEAQFISATRRLRRRLAGPQWAELCDRVIAPETGLGPFEPGDRHAASARTVVDWLWEDYLEASPLNRGDTRTTTQLLGNLAVISLREERLGYTHRRLKRLDRLDLAGDRFILRGPYLWFHFLSRSLSLQTARLVENYNAFALPLTRAATAGDDEIRRYGIWLARRSGRRLGQLPLAAEFRARMDSLGRPQADEAAEEEPEARSYQGNDFTSLHFLSAEPELEADIRRRYGDLVADLMRRDRRDNVRRVFQTFPLHQWPKQQRTVNPLMLYGRYLLGGRVLVFPVRLLGWGFWLLGRAIGLVGRFVGEVLHPTMGNLKVLEETDPFEVAQRKILRMRKPLVMECLRMRAEFDPEYLGVLPPRGSLAVGEAAVVPVEEDLRLLHAEPRTRAAFRRLASQRRRQMLELCQWLVRFDVRGRSAESLRAMAIAYTVDYRGVRQRLEAVRHLHDAFDEAIAHPARKTRSHRGPVSRTWRRIRYRKRLACLLEQPAFRQYGPERARCVRLIYARRGPLLRAVRLLTGKEMAGVDPVEHARLILEEAGRDPEPWSRQLVVLRAIQTLSILDLKTYCDLVAELGEYKS